VAKILTTIQNENWGTFIAKPVLGQESKACRIFRPRNSLQSNLTKYVVSTFKKYPGLIFQKFIHGFGKKVEAPEVRSYWVGNEYQFSMVATNKKIYCLSGEGHKPGGRKQNGVMRLPKLANIETLKDIAKRVIEVLQTKIKLTSPDGFALPLLMTRVDMGVMRDGLFKPWVNEVEYVPSYYVEDHTHPIEGKVAEQCAVISKKFLGIESFGDIGKSAACMRSPAHKTSIVSGILDDHEIVESTASNRSAFPDNMAELQKSPVLPDFPTSPIRKMTPSAPSSVRKLIPSAEKNADMCMDISFVDASL